MNRFFISFFLLLTNGIAFAGKYDEYQSNPNILNGASGSDDYVLAIMVMVLMIGSAVVAQLFKRDFYTPVKEVIIFIVICLAITYFWATHN
jgi:hypothetical protein